jgi:TrmH family RNA methyltransferase
VLVVGAAAACVAPDKDPPANGEAQKRRHSEQHDFGQEQADHFSRAARTPYRFNALLMGREVGENPKHLGGRARDTPPMPHQITSAANPQIKVLKSLHAKKGRAETGLFLAEGARLAVEASELGVWPEMLVYSPAALQRPQVRALVDEAERRRLRVIETSGGVLAQISKRENPQTVIGAYRQALSPLASIDGEIIVALEGVRDPGNLGTILRTADSTGASGVVLLGESCDPFSVEAVRASMGSIFAMKLARASFDELLALKNAGGAQMIGASLKGAAFDSDLPAPKRAIVLMGNEKSGLPQHMEDACDLLVKLPMRGRADSLNLAIATGVMLYDLWRRRGYDGARA